MRLLCTSPLPPPPSSDQTLNNTCSPDPSSSADAYDLVLRIHGALATPAKLAAEHPGEAGGAGVEDRLCGFCGKTETRGHHGSGKKVTRVEITVDGGESWRVCSLDHPESPNKYDKYWCWCFWSLDIEVLDLLGDKEIVVRAWDQ